MPLIQVQLNFDSMNVSAQVGDIVYFTTHGQLTGGFDNSQISNTHLLGPITSINGLSITVIYDNDDVVVDIAAGHYITFAKDKRINTSSLLGYYASVNFVNDSTGKVELFSVGSDVSESSK